MTDKNQALLEEALALRVPTIDELNKPLGNIRLDTLRVSTDEKKTQRLIVAGFASRFQRRTHLPRKDGRKLPTVIQLHPEGGAPAGNGKPARGRAARTYKAPAALRPSVEEMRALLARVTEIERILLEEKTHAITERIAETKRRLIDLHGDAEANAISELHQLTEARRSIASDIRRDAFARVSADQDFGPRRWLSLLSFDRDE